MKTNLMRFLFIFLITVSSLMVFSPANAYRYYYSHPGYYHGGYYHGGGYYRGGYAYRHCAVVGGYWKNGYWHPARRVCWVR